MSLEYTFKMKPGASVEFENRRHAEFGWDRLESSRLTIQGYIADSERSIVGESVYANDEYDDMEITVRLVKKFVPGYYRRNPSTREHPSISWLSEKPVDIDQWQRVEVTDA